MAKRKDVKPEQSPIEAKETAVEPAVSKVGGLLAFFRTRKRLSMRQLAGLAEMSHPNVSSIENGKKLPTKSELDRLSNALALGQLDRDRLQKALKAGESESGDVFTDPAEAIPIEEIVKMELNGHLQQVWVAVRYPPELHDDTLAQGVLDNMETRNCRYAYFLEHQSTWEELQRRLCEIGGEKAARLLEQFAVVVAVPEVLQPFIFNPDFTLYVKRAGERPPVLGVWTLRGDTQQIQSGRKMDDFDATELHRTLARIVADARQGITNVSQTQPVAWKVLSSPVSANSSKDREP